MTTESVADNTALGIAAPSEEHFRASFNGITPPVSFLDLPLGRTAFYLLDSAPHHANDAQQHQQQHQSQSTPIILIHGICTPAVGMLPIARSLQKQRPFSPILVFDLWGHGLSSSPTVPHTTSIVHQQLLGLLRHLKWTNVHLAGYSLGGAVAVTFAALYPTAIGSLCLIAPAGLIRIEELKDHLDPSDIVDMIRESQEEEKSQHRILTWLEGAPTIEVPSDWREKTAKGQLVAPALRQWQRDNHAGHIGSIKSYIRSGCIFNADSSFSAVAKQHKVPTLCILAENDDLISAEKLKQVGLDNIYTIPKATHGLARDNVPELVEAFASFLDASP